MHNYVHFTFISKFQVEKDVPHQPFVHS